MEFAKECDLDDGFRRISKLLETLDCHLAMLPGMDVRGMSDLRLVCDEIGSNVVRHSTPKQDTRLEIEIESNDESVTLRIIDNGSEFNPLGQELPYIGDDLDKRQIGGLGLYLVKQLFPLASYRRMDGHNVTEVEYHMGSEGNQKMQRASDLFIL